MTKHFATFGNITFAWLVVPKIACFEFLRVLCWTLGIAPGDLSFIRDEFILFLWAGSDVNSWRIVMWLKSYVISLFGFCVWQLDSTKLQHLSGLRFNSCAEMQFRDRHHPIDLNQIWKTVTMLNFCGAGLSYVMLWMHDVAGCHFSVD